MSYIRLYYCRINQTRKPNEKNLQIIHQRNSTYEMGDGSAEDMVSNFRVQVLIQFILICAVQSKKSLRSVCFVICFAVVILTGIAVTYTGAVRSIPIGHYLYAV
jgi:hypothetical protein